MNGGDPPSPEETRPGENLENCGDPRTEEEKTKPSTSNSENGIGSDHLAEGSEALAKAISSMLGAVTRNFDSRAEAAAKSQDDLSFSLDRLIGELDKLLEDAPLSFIMQHAAKISAIRKRISTLNLLLKSIERRIDNIDRMLSAGSSHGLETSTLRQRSS